MTNFVSLEKQTLSAQQQLASRQALQPLEAAQQYGAGVTSLISGYPGKEVITDGAANPTCHSVIRPLFSIVFPYNTLVPGKGDE